MPEYRVGRQGPEVGGMRLALLIVTLATLLFPLPATAQAPDPWFVEGDPACRRVALVFNIGIGETPSETVLNTLVDKGVAATMFPMGSFARSHPDYLRRLNDAGFEIGTHGDTNLWLTDASNMEIRADALASVDAIEAVIGREIDPWHTPFAANTDERVRAVIATTGLLPIGWRIAAPDWSAEATEEDVYNAVFGGVYPGAIVEMHLDGPATDASTARALPRLIDDLRARDFEFVTIGEMRQPCEGTSPTVPEPVTLSGLDVHGLHCTETPAQGAKLIRILFNGDVVTPRGPVFEGWLPVECAGQRGWVMAESVPGIDLVAGQ